jgi:amino acid transporter
VAQIVSAYPQVHEYRVLICVISVAFITVINLRGVRESGAAFAIPSYFFIAIMFITIGTGFFKYLTGSLSSVIDPPLIEHAGEAVSGVTAVLRLHAFSSGTAALTGVEAISIGTTAFKEPRSRIAGITLIWMAFILGLLFMCISFLTREVHAVPSEVETVISQLARAIFAGQGFMYLLIIGGTTVILILAANTAFAGFPRLSGMLASDGFMPRQLTYRGSRLVYSYGIVSLGAVASILIIVFQASVTRLIPLYAIGVFLSFTLAQSGMARRWWRSGKLKDSVEVSISTHELKYDKRWILKMFSNGFGALCTFFVMGVFTVTKFHDGAWIVLIIIPLLVLMFFTIQNHYKDIADHLTLDKFLGLPARQTRHRVIMPVSGVHQGTIDALRYARLLSDDVTAVHISMDDKQAEKIRAKWRIWGEGTRLVILDSPYRLFIEPLLGYIEEIIENRQPNETFTIVVPQFIASKRWHNSLHMQTAEVLRQELLSRHGVVVTDVPYHVYKEDKE